MATVSTEQLAKACNLTPRRIRQLVQEGMPRASAGRYDLGVCMSWYIRYLQGLVERHGTPEESSARFAMADAEMRKLLADAEMAEFKVLRERGKMILDADAVAEITRFCDRVRAMILSIRSRYQAELLNLRTIPEAGQALDRVAAGILTELQRDAGGTGETSDLDVLAAEGVIPWRPSSGNGRHGVALESGGESSNGSKGRN